MDNPSTTLKYKKYINITTLLSGVSFLLQLLAFATPGWMIMVIDKTILYMGLWYMVICTDSGPCDTQMYANIHEEMNRHNGLQELKLYQGLATTAIILSFIAIAAFISVCAAFKRADSQFNRILVISGFLSLTSGVLAVACAGKWADAIRMANDYVFAIKTEITLEFPFSLVIGGIGGLIGILSAGVLLFSKAWSMSPNVTSGGNGPAMPPVYFRNPAAINYTDMNDESNENSKPGY